MSNQFPFKVTVGLGKGAGLNTMENEVLLFMCSVEYRVYGVIVSMGEWEPGNLDSSPDYHGSLHDLWEVISPIYKIGIAVPAPFQALRYSNEKLLRQCSANYTHCHMPHSCSPGVPLVV